MLLLSFLLGLLLCGLYYRYKLGSLRQIAKKRLEEAELQLHEAKKILTRAKIEAQEILDKELKRLHALKAEENNEFKKLEKKSQQLQKKIEAQQEVLLKESSLSKEEKQQLIVKQVEKDSYNWILKRRQEVKESADQMAASLVIRAVQRLDIGSIATYPKNSLQLPQELLGQFIGKNGATLKEIERITEVSLSLDEFNLEFKALCGERRAIAVRLVEDLIRERTFTSLQIQKSHAFAKNSIENECEAAARAAFNSICLTNPHKGLISLLGKLKFRYSLGQNVLDHSIEVAKIMGVMADELGLNRATALRIGLFHDIGKALPHQKAGSHARLGMDLLLRYKEPMEVANGVGAHHQEIEPISLEGALCYTANLMDKNLFKKR